MNRVDILCARHRAVMQEFSRRTVEGLRKSILFTLIRPFVKDFMDANVAKEIKKDHMVIQRAGAAFQQGRAFTAADVNALFEATKKLDGEFLETLSSPVPIDMPYEEIEHIRKERIGLLAQTVIDLLMTWDDSLGLEKIVATAFPSSRFQEVLDRFFRLYNEETLALSRSMSVTLPVKMASDLFASRLFDIMESAARDITGECRETIFRSTA